jgi:uncharacterized protein YwqG
VREVGFFERLRKVFGGDPGEKGPEEVVVPKQISTLAELRAAAEKRGLGHRWASIQGLVRPCVRVTGERVDPGSITATASFFGGGFAYLRTGEEWPRSEQGPLEPLARVRLSDAAIHDGSGMLPRAGVLTFWYDMEAQTWGYDPEDAKNFRVTFLPEDAVVERREMPGRGAKDEIPSACRLTFAAALSLPDGADVPEKHELSGEEEYSELREELAGSGCVHQLLGFPGVIQNPMEEECEFASKGFNVGGSEGYEEARAAGLGAGAADWVLLFQIDTDETGPGWMWGDCGRLYYWIRKQDLAAGEFSRCWQVLQCF